MRSVNKIMDNNEIREWAEWLEERDKQGAYIPPWFPNMGENHDE